ncbi:hypothetical protein SLEP1_g18371 [Rubroshorea leprosula]|uniref:Uncharacterized protein n=1 Tax=Rubroshorea leprosula TaxID=152421 RepID=A0AAV5J329_9ROSI|nr:hypothetical protein SLEP1_g18371 [Rubroshorea leprosula]
MNLSSCNQDLLCFFHSAISSPIPSVPSRFLLGCFMVYASPCEPDKHGHLTLGSRLTVVASPH